MNRVAAIDEIPEVPVAASTAKHPPYPSYAPTGSAWLRDLPSHWKVRRLKFLATSRPSNVDKKSVDGEMPVRLCNYVDVYKNDYITPDLDFMQATADASELAKFRLRRGDVLITKDSEEWNDIAVPAFVTQDFDDVVCGYHLSQVRPRATVMDGEYLFRAFRASGVAEQFHVRANGITRFGLVAGAIGDVLFPVPPLDEQRAIAAFLDRETARIDTLIAKKQRLIELLHEKREAAISFATTRGTSPSVATRDSRVPWLGHIAAHWQVERLKFRYRRIEQGWSPQCENRAAEIGEWGILKVGCMNTGVYDERENKALPTDLEPIPYYEIRVGDFLMSRSNTAELVGSVGRVHATQGRIMLCDKLYRIAIDEQVLDPDFAVLLLRSRAARLQLARDATGASASMKNISNDRVGNLVFAFPDLNEQRHLVVDVAAQLRRLDDLAATISTASDRLREYRSALISAAVTGKIDVRTSSSASTTIDGDVPTVAELAAKPTRRANKHFSRCVLAAEIIDQHAMNPRFGRIKLQKLLILAEGHLRLTEIQSEPLRGAAGPFDNRMMRSVHTQLERQRWYTVAKTNHGTTYTPSEKQGGHREYFERYWGDKRDQFDALIALFKNATTEQAEIAATLYSAWNDFLIDGVDFDDKRLVDEVLSHWDPAKRRIEPARWFAAIKWMREKGLVPTGFGSHTRGGQSDDE